MGAFDDAGYGLRMAIEQFVDGSQDAFGSRLVREILEPLGEHIRDLISLDEDTTEAEREVDQFVSLADEHDVR